MGSNLGARERQLDAAVAEIARLPRTQVVRRSSWIETAPVGGPTGQGAYLNGAAEIETELDARELLDHLLAIERDAGRVRETGLRDGPRTLDLDLLLYGSVAPGGSGCLGESARIDEPGLVVPHPRLEERLFVLEPLREIAPALVLPSGMPIDERIELLRGRLRADAQRSTTP